MPEALVDSTAEDWTIDLEQLVKRAWQAGQHIDLTGVGYGRTHSGNRTDISTSPPSYYRFLAGLAAVIKARTALEIGTHWGGSAVALLRGMRVHAQTARVVTVDLTSESDNYLLKIPEAAAIIKIVGDANKLETIQKALGHLSSADLLYIDAEHRAYPTLLNFAIYSTLFRPKVAVFDDITFSDSMREFWRIVEATHQNLCINCNVVEPAIRGHPGFGLIVWPERWGPGGAEQN